MPAGRLRGDVGIAIGLVAATAAVFWQVAGHDFILFDDPVYVTQNPQVLKGLTAQTVRWALGAVYAGNWHPLTTLSQMLDCELFGPSPGAHHLINLAWHLAATVLLFLALQRLSGARWTSALVAALFGLHPLHVEAVAWVSERKEVLAGFFWMLTLWTYAWYAQRPGIGRYVAVAVSLALGLLAKPTLVTLPFVLLLLDYWPLGRMRPARIKNDCARLLAEKLPLFALVAVSIVVTLRVQTGAIRALQHHGIFERVANALHSYVVYLLQTVWPSGLAVFYPSPPRFSPWLALAEAALLVAVTVVAFTGARRRPYVLVGWLWYLGTLVPMIGLVQVGSQARADRYTYLSLIGIFIVVAWGLAEIVTAHRGLRVGVALATAMVLVGLCMTTWLQVARWKNTLTLFEHSARVAGENAQVLTVQAMARNELRQPDEAEALARRALAIDPSYVPALGTLGAILAQRGQLEDAIRSLSQAVRIEPDNVDANFNLGRALLESGRLDEAIPRLNAVLERAPLHKAARDHLGLAYGRMGEFEVSLSHYRLLVELAPDDPSAWRNLAIAAFESGHASEAVRATGLALDLAERSGNVVLVQTLREQLAVFSATRP